MTLDDLRAELSRKGIDSEHYSLCSHDYDDNVCLKREGLVWSVYYFERGRRFDYEGHATESEACKDVLKRLLEFKEHCKS